MGVAPYIYSALFGFFLGLILLPWRYKILGPRERDYNSLLFHFFLWTTVWQIMFIVGVYAGLIAYKDAWISYLQEQDRRNFM